MRWVISAVKKSPNNSLHAQFYLPTIKCLHTIPEASTVYCYPVGSDNGRGCVSPSVRDKGVVIVPLSRVSSQLHPLGRCCITERQLVDVNVGPVHCWVVSELGEPSTHPKLDAYCTGVHAHCTLTPNGCLPSQESTVSDSGYK